MFTGLKTQHELTDCFINDIVPHDHDLVKLKKVLNWGGINRVYESCYPSRRGNATKRTELTRAFDTEAFVPEARSGADR